MVWLTESSECGSTVSESKVSAGFLLFVQCLLFLLRNVFTELRSMTTLFVELLHIIVLRDSPMLCGLRVHPDKRQEFWA